MTSSDVLKSAMVAAIVALASGVATAQDAIGPMPMSMPMPPATAAVDAGAMARSGAGPAEAPATETMSPLESRPIAGGVAPPREERSSAPANSEAASLPSMRVIGSLMLVLAVIAVMALVVKRGAKAGGGLLGALGPGGRAPCGVMFVLGRYPVSRQSTLVLLQIDRRVLLLCQSHGRTGGGSMTTLAEITDPAEVASILTKTREADGDTAARKFEQAMAVADFNAARIIDDAELVSSGLRGRLGSIRRIANAALDNAAGGRAA